MHAQEAEQSHVRHADDGLQSSGKTGVGEPLSATRLDILAGCLNAWRILKNYAGDPLCSGDTSMPATLHGFYLTASGFHACLAICSAAWCSYQTLTLCHQYVCLCMRCKAAWMACCSPKSMACRALARTGACKGGVGTAFQCTVKTELHGSL